ncbi:Athe_2463 domain-containing protein [Thermovenabulum gondwanense]|uniref:Uncharacterized protein n=1 Tax=Thermovenabulum gondwanense TaxID=520767 RepID=A0A162MVU8_9FIRM|nr:hypothetical protein [Thermovenabulum gondwanense]KYO67971.1 hypothetical protein ATZ99_02800 [Thermovenabulum gondwanense]
MKKITALIIIAVFLITNTAYARPSNYYIVPNAPYIGNVENFIKLQNDFIKDYYNYTGDYFKIKNKNNKDINTWLFETRGLLVYGQPFALEERDYRNGYYRFLGYTMYDDYYTNELFPDDVVTPGRFDQKNWVGNPWDKEYIFRGKTIPWNYFDNLIINGKPILRESIVKGMAYFYADEGKFPKIGTPEYENAKNNIEWEKYVHVFQPPTKYAWGVGIAWHQTNEGTYYKTIPMAPILMPV